MTAAALARIAETLSEVGSRKAFSAKRTRPPEALHLEVKGIGRLHFPVSRQQAEQLCRIGRPARYGQAEKTLLDRRVRDTWEIPKSRVKIDLRRWKRALLPVLEQLGSDLGLPAGQRLKPDLHAMLVYAPGQFFLPHQDSEKGDEMVGTLAVTLPSSFKGGALVVEHQGERASYRGSAKNLSFVAFYADCRHEIRPVKEGYRVVLTYNLLLDRVGTSALPASIEPEPATVEALAESLREHFETPLPPRWKDSPLRPPPNRLVYLLDHQYTERGLGWRGLKGIDAARAAALVAAAERYDCECVLALVEIQETWNSMESGWEGYLGGRGRRRNRSWRRDDDDAWTEDRPPADGPDDYELLDLIESGISLTHCIDSSGQTAPRLVAYVEDHEVCCTTPSSELDAYASEYTGFMGNWGNTMDRWYHRAAIVLWPHQRTFAVRGAASPGWALETLERRLRRGERSEARELAASLLPFWDHVASQEERRGFFGRALGVAEALAAPELATSLLGPFAIEALAPAMARELAALTDRYGDDWARELLASWASRRRRETEDSLGWLGSLSGLCKALCAAGDSGSRCARLILRDRWEWLAKKAEVTVRLDSPSRRDREVKALTEPIAGLLEGAEICGSDELRDEAVAFLRAEENERLLPCLVRILRAAGRRSGADRFSSPALEALRHSCILRFEARLEAPAREEGDWSLDLPGDCRCGLCATLRAFLSDRSESQLEWPLAKPKRQHVHQELDRYELPVRHTTRRTGRPYTLVLSKERYLFQRDAKERRGWRSDLNWLARTPGSR